MVIVGFATHWCAFPLASSVTDCSLRPLFVLTLCDCMHACVCACACAHVHGVLMCQAAEKPLFYIPPSVLLFYCYARLQEIKKYLNMIKNTTAVAASGCEWQPLQGECRTKPQMQ